MLQNKILMFRTFLLRIYYDCDSLTKKYYIKEANICMN